eukprot:TRINITY_DN1362_c0_g2_i1.p1 TRINITY_DN1362_c0_g2~~TRINITY_DN1362_c0_g2_i1.p1  ORF type:complete len:433 (-),score=68.23 TRINITY_DN1362_c0_g2_i1:918-2216(-)
MRQGCCIVLLSLLLIHALVVTTYAKSLKVSRTPHVFHYSPPTTLRAGSVIPMSGGYLTLGAYFTNVTIGYPPQEFSLLVDTGSSNTAVPLSNCTSCGTGPFYYPYKSSIAQDITCSSPTCLKCVPEGLVSNKCVFGKPICTESGNCAFGITYGGGSSALYGAYYSDMLCIGPICGMVSIGGITDQYFFQTNFNSTNFYGILGLAYPFNACNPSCTTPVFEDMANQTNMPNIVGMCITGTEGGVMDMGFIDSTKYKGDLQYAPVITQRWYDIELLDVFVGTTSLGLRPFMYTTTNDVIGSFVDSGTSIILTSPGIFAQLTNVFMSKYSHLPGVSTTGFFAPGGINSCISQQQMGNNLKNFPNLNWVVAGTNGNITLTTPPSQYLLYEAGMYCLGIQGSTALGVVLGNVFMENYYIVFDRANNQLGFAELSQCN